VTFRTAEKAPVPGLRSLRADRFLHPPVLRVAGAGGHRRPVADPKAPEAVAAVPVILKTHVVGQVAVGVVGYARAADGAVFVERGVQADFS